MYVNVKIQEKDFYFADESLHFRKMSGDIGALVTFTGFVRCSNADGKPLESLTLEHYPGMAEKQIYHWIDEAAKRWPLQGLQVIHRVGRLQPGEAIVWVAAASQHRAAAFGACEFLMDHLKSAVAFWKKEAQTAQDGHWLESREEDGERLARWYIDG